MVPVIPALTRLGKENRQPEVSLDYNENEKPKLDGRISLRDDAGEPGTSGWLQGRGGEVWDGRERHLLSLEYPFVFL